MFYRLVICARNLRYKALGSVACIAVLAILGVGLATSHVESGPAGASQSPPGAVAPGSNPPLSLSEGDRVIIAGNTFAERMSRYGFLEAALHCAYPEHNLVIRNLGWSGDEVDLMPRPANFGSFHDHLLWQRADVVLLCYGLNESFGGLEGLPRWRKRLSLFLSELKSLRTNPAKGEVSPRLVLVSPFAHEDLGPPLPSGGAIQKRNSILSAYVLVMGEVARDEQVLFVDLFTPSLQSRTAGPASKEAGHQLTINGIHLTEYGYFEASRWLARGLGLLEAEPAAPARPAASSQETVRALRRKILDKNHHFFLFWRPLNPYYIWGGRAYCWKKDEPMRELEEIGEMVSERDRRIWSAPKVSTAEVWSSGRPPANGPELWEAPTDYLRERKPGDAPPAQRPEVRRNGVIK